MRYFQCLLFITYCSVQCFTSVNQKSPREKFKIHTKKFSLWSTYVGNFEQQAFKQVDFFWTDRNKVLIYQQIGKSSFYVLIAQSDYGERMEWGSKNKCVDNWFKRFCLPRRLMKPTTIKFSGAFFRRHIEDFVLLKSSKAAFEEVVHWNLLAEGCKGLARLPWVKVLPLKTSLKIFRKIHEKF